MVLSLSLTMYDVVVGVDENEARATAQATAIGELPGAAERIRTVVAHAPDVGEDRPVEKIPSVEAAVTGLRKRGITVETTPLDTDPGAELLELAKRRDADAICVAARPNRSTTDTIVFGSVTRDVLARADCTVIVPDVDT